MNTGPRPQTAFSQGNQGLVEQDASHSALLYLFQEVSKLSSPTYSVTNSSRQDNCIVNKEKDGAFSFQTCQHSLSLMSAYSHINIEKDDGPSSNVTTLAEAHRDCNSTWKVLNLINQQCERLMHRRDEEDAVSSSVSCATKLPKGKPTSKTLITEQDVRSDSVSIECTLRPSILRYDRQEITASVSPVKAVREDCSRSASKYKSPGCVNDSEGDCSVQTQTAKKLDAVIPKLVEENAAAASELQPGDKKEMKERNFNVIGELVWNQESKKDSFSSKQDIFNVSLAENSVPQTRIYNASQIPQVTFNSNEVASVALIKPTGNLDYNANIALPTESPCDMQMPSSSSILPSPLFFSITEGLSLSKQENSFTGQECTHGPTEESPPAAHLKSYNVPCTTSKSDPMEVQMEEITSSSIQQWRTKTPRKQPHPSRSVDIQDPDLQGVTFRMDTEVDNKEQCRLLITSKYSKELCKSVRKPKLRTRTSLKSLKTSSSEEEIDLTTNVSKDKVCASCCTRKTPMWRDAEDGTPLCNACGIRYKKYRVRCVNCWHIPKKEGNTNSCCLKCGNFVRLVSAQRKHTS
ncbi:hypothetical protein Q5P01_025102 [Channa striata]|uniref:GATA-type domain-containing protein n=1 Tax=Channa striata TaxID=64152 RepID=A0AA88IP10_CHASR|nr:hypothetical protein Q5P01_025102 [Channa striata]